MSPNLDAPDNRSACPLGKSILVVEDEALIRWALADELRDGGYHVIEARDASEALSILQCTRLDLILSDVRMPGPMDGLELLALVKQHSPCLPVIIMSGHLHPEQALKAGAKQFVAKPYILGKVLEAIADGLGTGHD